MSLTDYIRGVPPRLHDLDRYQVHRTVTLRFGGKHSEERLKVFESTGALVWKKGG